jgi:hypothetical protein
MKGVFPYNPEAQLLLDIVNNRPVTSLDGINFPLFLGLATRHNLIPTIFLSLRKQKDLKVPAAVYSSLQSSYSAIFSRNAGLWKEFLSLSSILRENNISFLPIKGIDILARFFPSFDLRPMCDMDILIKEDDLHKTEDLLSRTGWQKILKGLKEDYWRNTHFQFEFRKGPVALDLHWRLDFKRKTQDLTPLVWVRAQEIEAGGHKIRLLSPEDSLFAFALHLRRFGFPFSLQRILDAAKIIKQAGNFDWDYLQGQARALRMQATLYFILAQIGIFTETTIPKAILKQARIGWLQKKMIASLIKGCTFHDGERLKTDYLKTHFLLYDSYLEPLAYLINIPQEQFCNFFSLQHYSKKARFLYKLRLLYMPLAFLTKKE